MNLAHGPALAKLPNPILLKAVFGPFRIQLPQFRRSRWKMTGIVTTSGNFSFYTFQFKHQFPGFRSRLRFSNGRIATELGRMSLCTSPGAVLSVADSKLVAVS